VKRADTAVPKIIMPARDVGIRRLRSILIDLRLNAKMEAGIAAAVRIVPQVVSPLIMRKMPAGRVVQINRAKNA
jgi:hypothetical protein